MNIIAREIGHFFVGIMFLTRLPVPSGLRHVEGRLARSARYFPLVGVLIGALSGGVFVVSSMLMPVMVAAGLTLAFSLVLTGALHEDGLADCADGLGGGTTREHTLEIMRDSRVGTFGAAALIFTIGLRWSALTGFTPEQGLLALVMCHTISRAMIPPVLVSGHYARSRGLASSVADGVTSAEAGFAILFAFAVAMIAGPVAGLAGFAGAIIAGGLMLSVLIYRIGGYTGDGLGAIQQVAEITILLILASMWAA